MKRIITTLIAAIMIASVCHAQNEIGIVFESILETEGPVFRAPVHHPIQGVYRPSENLVYLHFKYPLGEVACRIESLDTGDYILETKLSDTGMITISTAGLSGMSYIIIIKTVSEQVYVGKFSIE